MGWLDWGQNDRIERKLDELLRRVKKMAAGEEQLKDAIVALAADLDAGIQAIKDKIGSIPGVDLTDEIAALEGARTKFDAAVEEIVAPPAGE